MTIRKISIVLTVSLCFFQGWAANQSDQKMDEWQALQISLRGVKSIRPRNGFVPDESTAAKIAEAAATAQYGEKTILDERPFHAKLYGDTWIVQGTLHPEGAAGGTAVVKLSKSDSRIVFMVHQY
jgi:hypothetical protein